MKDPLRQRRLPIGAEVLAGPDRTPAGTHFRVWAPVHSRVAVLVESGAAAGLHALEPEPHGYFSAFLEGARPGDLYRFRLGDDPKPYPDPASRFQPQGPHGPSQIIDPSSFRWTDSAWPGLSPAGQILYELHIGTFTQEGTFAAAAAQLPALAHLGVTTVELMPLADFPGRFGWGYDSVNLFAPCHLYGDPEDLRRFVDQAHALGLGVILDVVYNHLGPDGNYLAAFSPRYFSDRHHTEWGAALNFDGPDAGPVRELFLANAACWIGEFHLDGLRLDATQSIFDDSPDPILAAIGDRARAAGDGRSIYIAAEDESQRAYLVRPRQLGGQGLDALWNDDFHHSALVAATGRNEAYYSDYRGSPQELLSAAKWGYLFQGQFYTWQDKRRGTPALDLHPARFIHYLENHDQVANSAFGRRLHQRTSPGRLRALTALLLLGPGTPLLFQGQEFASSRPFHYFADHEPDLAAKVLAGRHEYLSQFPSSARPEIQQRLPDPGDLDTFRRCQLDLGERDRHPESYALHRDLCLLRRTDPALRAQRQHGLDGAVLGPEALALRFFCAEHGDRLLLINLGVDLHLRPAPEPLLAPPAGCTWELRWSSEDPAYGGEGTPPVDLEGIHVPGAAAVLLLPTQDASLRAAHAPGDLLS